MADMESIQTDVNELKGWKSVTEHRVQRLERERQEDVKEVAGLKAEVHRVATEISTIKGGISLLKWLLPISISFATAVGGLIAWVTTNGGAG